MALILHPHYQLYEKQDTAFCSSMQVAKEFSKRHDLVLRDIRELDCSDSFRALNFEEIRRIQDLGQGRIRKDPMYLMTKEGFMFLCFGYRGRKAAAIKEAIIKRFSEMEQFIKNYVLVRDDFLPFTQAIMDAHDEPKSYHYSNEYDMINRLVLGCTAKQFREQHRLERVSSIRPYLTKSQAKAIRKLQCEDIRLLYKEVGYQERKRILTTLYKSRLAGELNG